ncbi:hypothetical protein C0Q70_10958 [Pomacea canaliculata]|uniref:CW-type domain-containing protein n=1 Tax=Pomacea canaliculata TaxID=400727 RepID=A0A2T7P4N7_POMCA|nr:hypothetical protein C0Q70_10958 [Pomacea canaliculata]
MFTMALALGIYIVHCVIHIMSLCGSDRLTLSPQCLVASLRDDNAYDPDVAASELHINKTVICGKPCLIFEDNGNGMDHEHLLKMLSFGYCEKEKYENRPAHLPIGHYGNGFKSGSMRLAEDALVFTLCDISASVGFLSQTYLKTIKSDSVVIPMLEFRLPNLERIKSQESRNNLDAILKHTPFKTEQDIKEELRSINRNRTGTGTKIILYNLKRLKNGKLELDFESDNADIRNPEAHEVDLTSVYHRTSHVETSEYVQSLRTYCSILFLRPRMKIFIRGVRVKSKLISKSLSQTEIDVYKPTWMERPLKITFGFVCNKDYNKEDYGVMFYHRNRLIKPYEKLGYQKQPNELGVGVVGVVQVDFLKPIHNKQDFQKDEKYNAIMSAIALKLNDYWNEKKSGKEVKDFGNIRTSLPDWLWVQCERCLKWRRLPDSARSSPLPDQWYCHMNPDPTHNRCDILEEPEDEDQAVQRPTYAKTFKKQMEERKRRKQADINAKEAELKAKEAELLERQRQQQLNEVSSSQESSRSIANLQKALMEAKKREETHKRLILQIQNQKKQLELEHQSLLQAANSLQNTNTDTAELLQVAAALTGESPVSSTSGKGGKRKTLDLGEGGGKRIDIKMETGEMVSIERNDDVEDEEMPADQTSFLEPYTSSPNERCLSLDTSARAERREHRPPTSTCQAGVLLKTTECPTFVSDENDDSSGDSALKDNAYDPDVAATELHIDKCEISGMPCLLFRDNGRGMDHDHLLKMLSFGFCEKDEYIDKASYQPIGHYGNGFKSGSMRLADDAIVFTICKGTGGCEGSAGIGFLSRTYLEAIKADSVIVPILQYSLRGMERINPDETTSSLEAILEHSPFKTEKELKQELQAIRDRTHAKTGTTIVLFNLKRLKDGNLELDFESDNFDIRYPETHEVDPSICQRASFVETAEYIRSLQKKTLQITFGFVCNSNHNREDYGVMFYHRNRLIKPYEKLGFQKQPNDLGVGVVGVVEADFLEPIHNKQDFKQDGKYNNAHPDWTWAQCDNCLKWRKLPDGTDPASLPDKWYCYNNRDPTHSRCEIEQEPEEEDLPVQRPTYTKTFKRQMQRRKSLNKAVKEAELNSREADLQKIRQQKLDQEVVAAAMRSVENIYLASRSRGMKDKRKRSDFRENDEKRICFDTATDQANAVRSGAAEDEDMQPVDLTILQQRYRGRTSSATPQFPDNEAPLVLFSSADSTPAIEKTEPKNHGSRSIFESIFHPSPTSTKPQTNDNDRSLAQSPGSPTSSNSSEWKATSGIPVQGGSTRNSLCPDDNVVDLTQDDVATETSVHSSDMFRSEDVKPDVNKLKMAMEATCDAKTNETLKMEITQTAPSVSSGEVESKPQVNYTSNQLVQTDLSEEDVIRCMQSTEQYALLEQRFNTMQNNIRKIFQYIVPDFLLNTEHDMETIVASMIRKLAAQDEDV